MVRAALPEDAAVLAEVEVAAWKAAYRGFLPAQLMGDLSPGLRADTWRATLADERPPAFTLASTNGGGAIEGFCSVVAPARDADTDARTAELTAVYVHPARWNAGVGRGVVTVALDRLREEAWDDVILWVFLRNAQGRAFFARLGFRLDGVQGTHAASGSKTTRMRTRLASR